jgi:hypothetical protein
LGFGSEALVNTPGVPTEGPILSFFRDSMN